MIADQTALLVWFQTKSGHKNRNRPKSYVKMLQGGYRKTEQTEKTYRSGEEFEKARQQLIEGIDNGIRTRESIRTDNTDN